MNARPDPESQGFDQAIRTLVRNSPWWMISMLVHLAVLAVLWNIEVAVNHAPSGPVLTADLPRERETIQELPDPPKPEIPPEARLEKPVPTDVEVDPVPRSDDFTDEDPRDPGPEGLSTGPFTGSGINTALGLGGNSAGGGGKGGKGRRGGFVGSSRETRGAVELGLQWLADHQDLGMDGRWDCDDFMKHDEPGDRCDGAGAALYDTGVTGLALLAFLGAGYTDRGTKDSNPFARHVREGLRFLVHSQDDEGCFGTRTSEHFQYNHAIATLAMCEAFWMTRNPMFKKPAQDGLAFIARSRNPYLAWRYEPRGGDNDTSVTGWMVMALKSGHYAGLDIDPDAFAGARTWVDKMTDPEFGTVGYNMPGGQSARPEGLQERFPAEKTQAMTAAGILCRIFLGEDPRTSKAIRMGADLCCEQLPAWNPDDGSIDMYYWYYATLALYQVGGTHWARWNKAMLDAIVKSQHPRNSGSRTGSWDPIGPWGPDGGRVYSTAVLTMCLEVYYRYDRVFGGR